jgi:hypothetical protein
MRKVFSAIFVCFMFIFQLACGDAPASENAANFGRDKVFPTPLTEHPSLEIYLNEYVSAQNRKDEEKIFSLTYPKAIEIEGGRENFLKKTNQMLDSAESFAFLAGKPTQTLKKDNAMLIVMPVSMKQKVKEGWQFSRAVIAGVTEDEGRHWTFADVSDKEKRKHIFPAFADQMEIPEIKSPWIEK